MYCMRKLHVCIKGCAVLWCQGEVTMIVDTWSSHGHSDGTLPPVNYGSWKRAVLSRFQIHDWHRPPVSPPSHEDRLFESRHSATSSSTSSLVVETLRALHWSSATRRFQECNCGDSDLKPNLFFRCCRRLLWFCDWFPSRGDPSGLWNQWNHIMQTSGMCKHNDSVMR